MGSESQKAEISEYGDLKGKHAALEGLNAKVYLLYCSVVVHKTSLGLKTGLKTTFSKVSVS